MAPLDNGGLRGNAAASARVERRGGSGGFGLAFRLALAGALLLTEVVSVTLQVGTDGLNASAGLAHFAAEWGSLGLRTLVAAAMLTATFALFGSRLAGVASVAGREARQLVSLRMAAANLAALAAFGFLSIQLFHLHLVGVLGGLVVLLCTLSGLVMLVSGALVFVSVETWRRMFQAAPLAPVYGFSIALAITPLAEAGRWIWVPWMRLTYAVVLVGLRLIRGEVVADAANFTIGTTRFSVAIASGCSGYEGVALMLVFGSAWLWFFRREFRFPQALLLLPAGAAAIWMLNCVRIIALILIGDAGAPGIAAGGFHSEAGWIAFIGLAAGVSLASQRIRWLAATPRSPAAESRPLRTSETAAYLTPFLAILAAGMVARAASASFEWLYPTRVLATTAALWWFRRTYSGLNRRIGWESAAAGAVAFVIWMGAERLLGPHVGVSGMPAELAAAAGFARFGWLAFRVTGAVVTVPIAED